MPWKSAMGVDTTVSSEALNALKTDLRGPILFPGEPGFEDSRTVWNGMIDRRPSAVVRSLGVADVKRCIQFVREQGLRFTIKGGGHNIAGLAACDGGLMLDMSLMRGVLVDEGAKIAHAQPGCLLGDVDRETQVRGLAAVLGFVSNTGITGLTLGGGFGYVTRRFGWTSDNVVAMEIVTADGRIVQASEREHPDLFWGLRGGGGNFGVVTRIDYRLYPLGPEIMGGLIAWPASEVGDVLRLFRDLSEDGPAELTTAAVLRPAPPAPWLPKEMHGRMIIALAVCYTGSPAEAERVVGPIRSFGKPVGDVLQPRSYVSQQSILDATQPKGRRYYWKSEYLASLPDALLERFAMHGDAIESPHSAIILFPVGGALNRIPGDHSAVGNRDARYVLNVTAAWEKADEDAKHVAWARSAWQDLRSYSTGGTYVNFLTDDEPADRVAAAYGANLQRLAEIKAAWDPENLFRTNKNVVPAGVG